MASLIRYVFLEGTAEWVPADSVPGLLPSPAEPLTASVPEPLTAEVPPPADPPPPADEAADEAEASAPPPPPQPPPPLVFDENSPLQARTSGRFAPSAKATPQPPTTPPPPPDDDAQHDEALGLDARLAELSRSSRLSRSRKRETAIRSRSCAFTGRTSALFTPVPEPPPPPPPPPPAAPPSSSGLFGAIQDFNKEARLRKVRRASTAFANGRRSLSGRQSHRHSLRGGPPPPPPPGADLQGDIAAVLARAIMRRRTESRIDEDSGEEEPTSAESRAEELAWR